MYREDLSVRKRLHKNAAFFPINYKEIRRKIAFAFLRI